jgi:hypothetical protein
MVTTTPVGARELGQHALQGWRKRLADATAPKIAERTGAKETDIRAIIGLVFIALAVRHLAVTFKRFARPRN